MFEDIPDAELIDVMGEATRDESTAIAQRLVAVGELYARRAHELAETLWWRTDPTEEVAAEISAAQNISRARPVGQIHYGRTSRERLPEVAKVFAGGVIDFRMVSAIIARTENVDDEVMTRLDEALARHAEKWMKLSGPKLRDRLDLWVAKFDPAGVRVPPNIDDSRYVEIVPTEVGMAGVFGNIHAADGAALAQRLEALAATVCGHDPRTMRQRRADACGPLARGQASLACQCGRDDCAAAAERHATAATVIHLLAEQATLNGTVTSRAICPGSAFCPPSRCARWPPRPGSRTTWEPVDLGPYLRGEIRMPRPSLGMARSDGQLFIYPGCEHAIVGETESGKTWLALGCAAAEMTARRDVVYIHFEEPNPLSTIERLRLLDVDPQMIAAGLRFVAPTVNLQFASWLEPLLDPPPALVVLDGINEAMSLLGAEIKEADGVALFRRALVTPFLKVGAATIACDHVPMTRDPSRRDAYGSVHKGNALTGARIALETIDPFGRAMRGVSNVYITKDRPGRLRAHGRVDARAPGKTYFGTLVVDDMIGGPDFMMRLWAPNKDDDASRQPTMTRSQLADIVYDVLAGLPDQAVGSREKLYAHLRANGQHLREEAVREVLEDLIVAGRVKEVSGPRGAKGYAAIATPAQDADS